MSTENKKARYAMTSYTRREVGTSNIWPWEDHWWKPESNRIRELEKAGALIAAEIDRLLRKASSVSDGGGSPVSESPQTPLFASGVEKWTVLEKYKLTAIFCEERQVSDYCFNPGLLEVIAAAHNASLSLAEARAQEAEVTITRLVALKDRLVQAATENKAEADALSAQLAEAERKLREKCVPYEGDILP